MKVLEEKLTSVPLVGDLITKAREQSVEDFNRMAINRVLKPIGQKLDDATPVGRQAIAEATEKASKQYDDVLKSGAVVYDDAFEETILNLNKMVEKLPEPEQRLFRTHVNELLANFDNPNKKVLGETFQTAERAIREIAKKAQKGDVYQSQAGDALAEAHKALLEAAKRQSPEFAKNLADANQAWAMLKEVQKAGSRVGAKEGVFTPEQFFSAVKQGVDDGWVSTGKKAGIDFADTAKSVLGKEVPNSGTVDRALAAGGVGYGAALEPMTLGVLGAASAPYTKTGQKIAESLLTKRPAMAGPVRKALENQGKQISVPLLMALAQNQ